MTKRAKRVVLFLEKIFDLGEISGMLQTIPDKQIGTGKKVLTYQVHSDNQDGNQVIFVYNIEFGSALISCGA